MTPFNGRSFVANVEQGVINRDDLEMLEKSSPAAAVDFERLS